MAAQPVLGSRDWIENLSAETRQALMAVGRTRRIPAGATLYCASETPDGVYHITGGSAYMHLGRRNGEMLLLRIMRPGEVFGELVALDSAPAPVFISARTELSVVSFPRAEFTRLKSAHPEIRDALVKALSIHLRALLQILEEIALLSLPERARARLCTLAQETSPGSFGKENVSLDITQSELALMLAASRPATNKMLAGLHEAGEIALRFKAIDVRPSLIAAMTRRDAVTA